MKVSVSLRAGNVRAVRERAGARGFSAYVAATALRLPKPVIVLTSDADDMTVLCGKGIKVVPV